MGRKQARVCELVKTIYYAVMTADEGKLKNG